MIGNLFLIIARKFPDLKYKLKKSGLGYKPEVFIKRTFLAAFYITTGVIVSIALLLAKFDVLKGIMIIFVPILFFLLFFYMLKFPEVMISKKEKEITKEIVFAGKYLIIELESGVALYNALGNISKSYPVIGSYFQEIVNKVDLGTSMEDALTEAVEYIPSENFRRLLWQILNSMRTGSDVAKSLSIVLDQISREQIIEVNKYGRKLNPLAMFYMIIAVILPTLGITMMIVFSSFIDIEINLTILMVIAFLLAFLQFMFLSMIRFSRPAVEF